MGILTIAKKPVTLDTREYNGFGQMVSLRRDNTLVRYAYRPDGLRHSKAVQNALQGGCQITTHHWDGQNMMAEMSGGEIFTTYLRGSALIAQKIDANLYYYLHNGHGDVVQRIGGDENAAPMYEYDAFGNQKEEIETDPNPFRYCGEYWDGDAEEYYFRARTYNPETGRFGQEDSTQSVEIELPNGNSILDPLSLNGYTYCEGDPIRYRDTRGRLIIAAILIGALLGGLSGGISAAISGEDVLWGAIGGMLVGGIMGGVTSIVAIGPALSMLVGAGTNAVNSIAQQWINNGAVDIGEVVIDALYGIASGYAGWGMSQAIKFLSKDAADATNKILIEVLLTGMEWLAEESLVYGATYATKHFYRMAMGGITPEEIQRIVRSSGGSTAKPSSDSTRRSTAPRTPTQQAAEDFFRNQVPRPQPPSRFTPYTPEGYQQAYEKYLKDLEAWKRKTGRAA